MKRSWLKVSNRVDQKKVETFLQYAIPFLKQLGYLSKTRKFPYKELVEKFERAEPYITFVIGKEDLRRLAKALEDHYFWSDIIDKFWDFVRTMGDYETATDYALKVNPQDLINRIEQSFKVESNVKEKWLKTVVSSWLKVSRVISDIYPIDFSQSYDINYVRKLATALYLLPEIEAKSVDDLISKIAKEYQGQYQLFRKFFTTTNLKNENLFKLLINIAGELVNRSDLDQIKSKLASKEILKTVNKHLNQGTLNTVEDFLAIVKPEGKTGEVTEKKPEVDFILKDTKYIDDNRYDLYLALTPKGIKQLANSGFNTWCVNSWNYARSYYTSSRNMGKQFWFIFKNNAPLFAIGGSDGVSDLIDDSLSELSKPILESDYKALQEWQNVYNYPLEEQKIISKEEFERMINKLVDDINSGKVPSFSDWSIILTYSDFFRDKIDLNKLLEAVLKMNYSIQRADGEKIGKAEFLTYIAKFLNRGSFENNPNIDPNILTEVQKKIGSDFDTSVDYLTTVIKGYKPDKYGIYMEGLIETIDPEEFDEDYAEDLSKIIDLRIKSNVPLTDKEKEHIKKVLSYEDNVKYTSDYPNIYEAVGIDIMSIAIENPISSYYFAVGLLKSGKEIPNEITQSISKDPKCSYYFAIELLKSGKDIPNELIQSISEDSYWSYEFSQYLNFDKSRIPLEIQESAKKYEGYEKEFENRVVYLLEVNG